MTNCPFYNSSVMRLTIGEWAYVRHASGTGNRCGVITNAHSPCYMEVYEQMAPDWQECPRNPMFVAEHAGTGAGADAVLRAMVHQGYTEDLVKIRAQLT